MGGARFDAIIVGGGLAGLVAAWRLAEAGARVAVLEAAPKLGGRLRAADDPSGIKLDAGMHLVAGAYRRFLRLIEELGQTHEIGWQARCTLAVGHPGKARLVRIGADAPLFALRLAMSLGRAFGLRAMGSLFRLVHTAPHPEESTAQWLARARIPPPMLHEWLEPLHRAALNAELDETPAATTAAVIREAFASARTAKLGWFRCAIEDALIQPLAARIARRGGRILTTTRVLGFAREQGRIKAFTRRGAWQAPHVVLAVSPQARAQLFGGPLPRARPITTVYLWADTPALAEPIVGLAGTPVWWLDVSAMRGLNAPPRLLAAVASNTPRPTPQTIARWVEMLSDVQQAHIRVRRIRTFSEARATFLPAASCPPLPEGFVDAARAPHPGEIPDTIEHATRRGETAATAILRA